jgi:Anti-sigma-K factor rskA
MEAALAMPAPSRIDPARLDEKRTPNGGLTLASPATPLEWDTTAFELPPPDRISGATLATLAALAGMAAIALGTWAFVMSLRDDGTTQIIRPPISEAAQAISLLAHPGTVRLPLAGADGRAILAVADSGRGMLVLDGLGIAPVGRTYQAWVLNPEPQSDPLQAAMFTGVETVVPLTARVQPGAIVGVTVERAGGAATPTRALELTAQRPARGR